MIYDIRFTRFLTVFALLSTISHQPSTAYGQLPTNNLAPSSVDVAVGTNGALINPTNFFHANQAALNAEVSGGGGAISPLQITGNTNIIPPGATYDNGSSDMANNGPNGDPAYAITVATNEPYVFGNSNAATGDQGIEFYCASTSTPGYFGTVGGKLYGFFQIANGQTFVSQTNTIYVSGVNPSSSVLQAIYPASNNYYGSFFGSNYGTFNGSGSGLTGIPNSALSSDVLLRPNPLFAISSNANTHVLISSNSQNFGSGSTLTLIHTGTNGYADVNFATADTIAHAQVHSYTLRFAIGVEAPGTSDVYSVPYIELVDNSGFNFVTVGNIYGGVHGGNFNWVWYQDGTTNRPMVNWDRASGTLSNYAQATFESNVTLHGSAKLSAPNLTVTNAPTLLSTNIPGNTSTVRTWFAVISTNGQTYYLPGYQ